MNRHRIPQAPRPGFTLFEVGISMLLVSFGVVSVLMIFPVGLRQTQASRYKVLAAAKAVEFVDAFSGSIDEARMMDTEVPEPWEGRCFAYTNNRWDLEQHICNFRYGIHPLPLQIARRLDSEGDEIQRILDSGAYLYYAMPTANLNLDERWQNSAPPNEARSMIFAVVGEAQHNAIPRLPQKAWPYRHPYPSAPQYMDTGNGNGVYFASVPGITNSMISPEWWQGGNAGSTGNRLDHVLTGNPNPFFVPMFDAFMKFAYFNGSTDYHDSDSYANKVPIPPSRLKAYVETTINYCRNMVQGLNPILGVDPASELNQYFLPQVSDEAALTSLGGRYDRLFAEYCASGEVPVNVPPVKPHLNPRSTKIETALITTRVEAALRVQSMRYLAQAMTSLFSNIALNGGKNRIRRLDIADGDNTSDQVAESIEVKGIRVTPGLIRYLHERSLAMVMRYVACFPYDWGQPRPHQRQIMTDFPLIELDLFSPPRSGMIGGQVAAAQWKPISAQPISNLGPSLTYPGTLTAAGDWVPGRPPYPEWDDADQSFWGNPDHFTLTKTFEPAERCRQLVFWSVDWQMYEDAELAPAAPVDASRHPFSVPRDHDEKNLASRLAETTSGYNGQTQFWRMSDNYAFLNPELRILFRDDVSGFSNGSGMNDHYTFPKGTTRQLAADVSTSQAMFNGVFGADRNFNRQIDRGPFSQTMRLRAATVARFHYYDPRIPVSMR